MLSPVNYDIDAPAQHANGKKNIGSAHQLRTPIIVPHFWTGTPPIDRSRYVIDCAQFGLKPEDVSSGPSIPAQLAKAMHAKFDDVGLVLLTNTGLGDDLQAMKRCAAEILGPNAMEEYKAGANARKALNGNKGNVFETGAPGSSHLHYHHEMAYVSRSTRAVAFCCTKALPQDGTHRGSMFVSEAVGHTDALMRTALGQKLKETGITYIRCLTDKESGESDDPNDEASGVYNHWQTSFGVNDPEEAEAIARSRGLEVAWGPGRYMKTKYTASAFEYCPQVGRNLLYASVSDDSIWFDAWPGVRHLPALESFETATPMQRPLKITFGDGTEFTRSELRTFIDVYDQYGLPLDWTQGDVAVVCNHRWAHGRPAYSLHPGEERTLGVMLGEMYTRIGDRADRWAQPFRSKM